MTYSLDSKAATKVIAKACNWVDRRKAAQAALPGEKARQVGRLEQSGDELVQAVDKLRQAERKGD